VLDGEGGLETPPAFEDEIVFLKCPDLYHKSSDSGEIQYKLRELKKVISSALKRTQVSVLDGDGALETQLSFPGPNCLFQML